MKVCVISSIGTKIYKRKKASDGDYVWIHKGKGRKVGWKVFFTQTIPTGLLHIPTIYVLEGASKAISFDFKAKTEDQTPLTRKDIQDIADKLIPKARYGDLDKQKTPAVLYIVALMTIFNLILTFAIGRGLI